MAKEGFGPEGLEVYSTVLAVASLSALPGCRPGDIDGGCDQDAPGEHSRCHIFGTELFSKVK